MKIKKTTCQTNIKEFLHVCNVEVRAGRNYISFRILKVRYSRVKCRMAPIFVARLLTQRKRQISILSSSLTLATSVSRSFTTYTLGTRGISSLFLRRILLFPRNFSTTITTRHSRLKSRGRNRWRSLKLVVASKCRGFGRSQRRERASV